jgi:predicted phage tail protein
MAGGAHAADDAQVNFHRVEGDVRVKRAGGFSWESADVETPLGIGDQIKTSASASAEIIYFDGTKTTIQPGSLLVIKELYENPVTKVRKVSEKLNWGEARASTQRRNVDGSFHQVETEKVKARTEDEGEFRVAYDQEKKTGSFAVFGGRIEVAGPERKEVVNAGERIRSNAEGGLSSKELLPGVPRLVSPPDQRIFIYEKPEKATTRLAWERVPGAKRYHLLISDRYLFTEPLYDAARTDTDVVIDGITPGEYYWKVAAVSQSDVEGPFSPTREFRVTTQTIRDTGDTTPPRLEITDLVQTGAMLIINGTTEPGAQVWVDNDKVDVSDDGTFYTVLRLRKEGTNVLKIVAQDAAGNQEVKTHQAYVESY